MRASRSTNGDSSRSDAFLPAWSRDTTGIAVDSEAFARGVLGDTAVDWVVYLADEMDPWLKWKVYDILFAVAALLAGRMLARRAVSHYHPELE